MPLSGTGGQSPCDNTEKTMVFTLVITGWGSFQVRLGAIEDEGGNSEEDDDEVDENESTTNIFVLTAPHSS